MTGITASQDAMLERILVAAADPTIRVTAFFEGMPSAYVVSNPFRTEGVLEFQTVDGSTARIREDTLIGIIERAD